MMNKICVLVITVVFVTSCSSESEDNTMSPPQINNITYTGNVKTIIDNKCLDCHGDPVANAAPMILTTFPSVKESVENRNLIGRVENGSMPPGGNDLTAVEVQTIIDWQLGGFKE